MNMVIPMDITKLKSFISVTNYESFSTAAENLYLSQPAVSKHVMSLEKELNVKLFNRSANKLSLTTQGEAFLPYAQEIVMLYDSATAHLQQIENNQEGILNFGATNYIGVHLMPQIIKKFNELYPNIIVNMDVSTTQKLAARFEVHEMEFALLFNYANFSKQNYNFFDYREDELVIAIHPSHPLAHKNDISLFELTDDTFIGNHDNTSIISYIRSELHDFPFKKRLYINNEDAIKHAVIENLGFSILSEHSIVTEVANNQLCAVRINDFLFKRNIKVVYRKNFELTPAAKAFFKLLKENVEL